MPGTLAEFLQFGDSFDKVCGELDSMLVAGAVRPKVPVLSAEQIAMLKAALVQHVPFARCLHAGRGRWFCRMMRAHSVLVFGHHPLAGVGGVRRRGSDCAFGQRGGAVFVFNCVPPLMADMRS